MTLHVSPRRTLPAVAVAVLLAALGLVLTAPRGEAAFSTPQCQGANVDATGGSLANAAQAAWKSIFGSVICPGGPTVAYNGAGSGAGLESLGARRGANVDGSKSRSGIARFAGTDDPPSPTQIAQINGGTDAAGDEGKVHTIPAAVAAVAPLVNFPNSCDVTLLDDADKTPTDGLPNTVRIRFTKDKWEAAWRKDPTADTWAELFPKLNTDDDCKVPIIRVVRWDASGSTFAFKAYLNGVNPALGWSTTFESGTSPNDNRAWPNATFGPRADCSNASGPGSNPADQLTSACGTNGAGALVDKLKVTDGSIGYADVATARGKGLAVNPAGVTPPDVYWSELQNGANSFTEPTADPHGFRTDGQKGANCGSTVFANVPADTFSNWVPTSGILQPIGYGLCTLTYGLVFDDNAPVWGVSPEEEAKARTIKDYWSMIVSAQGQGVLFANDYSPLPGNILSIAQAGVAQIDWNKQGLGGGGNGGGGGGNGGGGGQIVAPLPLKPSNVFSVPSTALNSKKGTATFSVRLPGAGQLAVKATSGKGKKRITVGSLRRSVSKAGTVKLTLTPGSKAMKALKKKGSLKASVTITFTPQGGSAKSSTRTVTFKFTKPKKKG